jgi:HlyD family secretion protein
LREIESSERMLQQVNRVSDLTLQFKRLEIEEEKADHDLRELRSRRDVDIAEQRRLVERLTLDVAAQSEIKSQYSGRVLEIQVSPGQMVQSGDRMGTIEVDDANFELKCLAYFPVKDGKRISEGMTVHITPSTVQREREGAIIGRVSKCSKFPITRQGATTMVGNSEIAEILTEGGGMIEVEAELDRDPDSFSGYRWTSKGPELKFSAGTTSSVRVTVENRAPITYVLPILKTWLGGKDDALPNS